MLKKPGKRTQRQIKTIQKKVFVLGHSLKAKKLQFDFIFT
jgi:hypothetical protein